MRILDINGIEMASYDEQLGRVVEEQVFVTHHDAIEAVKEVWHYEVIREYPNGGRDVDKVIDVPGVEAQEAWDEYETILRYTPYTQEELKAMEDAKIAQISMDDMAVMMADHEYRICMMELGVNDYDI